jgi:hypothetical protein
MKTIRTILVALVVGLAALGASAAAASQRVISSPALTQSTSGVAERWVSAIDRGNQAEACEMQAVGTAAGLSCAQLPSAENLKCPKFKHQVFPKKSEVRSPVDQIGPVTEETPDRVFFVLLAQKRTSKVKGAVGVEKLGEVWKITYLRQGQETFAPAGDVYNTDTWRKLWYPPTCAR